MTVLRQWKIGDHCLVGDGAHASIKRRDNGVPYLTSRNFKDGELNLNKIDYISEEDFAKHFNKNSRAVTLPQPDDVVFSIIGTIGEPYLVRSLDRFGISSSVAILRPDQDVVDPKYLCHWVKGHIFQDSLYGIKGGVAQGYVSLEMIRSLPLWLPPLATQRKIVAILSAYDDLIENNTLRIAILEEMAQLIYREWFVHFRFPGHEDVEMVETEMGMVPAGWEVMAIDEAVETIGGGTPRTKREEYWEDGEIVWYTPSDLTAAGTMFMLDSSRHINELGLNNSSAKMFPAYSMMMTSRATLGVTAINTTPACTNQGFITCVPSERLSVYQLYFWVAENLEKIINLAGGATYKEIRKTTFREMPVVVPDEGTTQRFVDTVEPIGQLIETLQRKNTNLRETRDLLLPRLVSGELDVSDIESIEVDEGVKRS